MANRNLFKIEMLILKVLDLHDCYGYQLAQEISETSGGQFKIAEGTMYPIMYKLEEAGYISGEKILVKKRQQRVYYHLESKGKEHLAQLISDYRTLTDAIDKILESAPPDTD